MGCCISDQRNRSSKHKISVDHKTFHNRSHQNAQNKAEVDAQFDKFDKNKDGFLSKSEINAMVKYIINKKRKEGRSLMKSDDEYMQALLNVIDKNKDSMVSRSEFHQFYDIME